MSRKTKKCGYRKRILAGVLSAVVALSSVQMPVTAVHAAAWDQNKFSDSLKLRFWNNEQYECCSNKKFMKVLETIARMNGNEEVYIEDMYACNKEARNYYLSELMMCFNFVFNEMCHGTGSAAGCDFNSEEE